MTVMLCVVWMVVVSERPGGKLGRVSGSEGGVAN